jgi:hypothetical protein
MAEEIIGLKINVDTSGAEKPIGNIRQELREANRALVDAQTNFGDYSQEALGAARRVAELRDRVQEASETAALFDPGQKFKAFSGSLQAVAGGFAAVQGALGLVGVESEDLQKQLLKVQSALALSEGLSRISDSAKDFRRLGAVIQQTTVFQKSLAAANLATAAATRILGVSATTTSTGFKVLRGAIVATGIGALAIGIIALVQNFDKLKAALLNAIPGLKTIADGIGNLVNRVTDFLGITSEVERQTAKALEENTKAIKATERELELNADKYDEFTQRKIKANLDYRKNLEELLKDEKLTEQERTTFIRQAREKANREISRADKDRQAAADKAAEDGRKKAQDAAKQQNAERAQVQKEGEAELVKLRDEATLAAIANETERALKAVDIQVAADRKRIEATKLSEGLKQALLTELEAKGERERQAIRDKAAQDAIGNQSAFISSIAALIKKLPELQKEQDEKNAERLQANLDLELEIRRMAADTLAEQRQVELDAINAEYDARVARAAKTAEDIYLIEQLRAQKVDEVNRKSAESDKALAKMRTQQRVDQLEAISQVARDVAKVVGEQTALGKTLAIASAVIETALSAQRAYSSLVGIPVVGPVLAPIAAGAAIAAGIKNIRTIQQTRIPGATGGAGGAIPSISAPGAGATATAPIAPQANAVVVGQTLNRDAINRAGSAATRAYVVESDVTSSQERIKRLERAARLG